jgi:hypothetical protein
MPPRLRCWAAGGSGRGQTFIPTPPQLTRSGVNATGGCSRDASRVLILTVPIPACGWSVPACRNVVSCLSNTLSWARRQSGGGMPRPNLLGLNVRMMQQMRGGSRLGPALTRRRQPADRALAQPAEEPRQALRMPDSRPLARRQLCRVPVAQSYAPLNGE